MAAKRKTSGDKAARSPRRPSTESTKDAEKKLAIRDRMSRQFAPAELDDPEKRRSWGLDEYPDDRGPYLVELNIQYISGLKGAAFELLKLFAAVCVPLATADGVSPPPAPVAISKSYVRCIMRAKEWRALVAADEARAVEAAGAQDAPARHRCIYRIWPDFPIKPHINRSVSTVKADAAERSFEATGADVVWAVIDSGVQGDHPHFGSPDQESTHALLHASVRDLHRCYAPQSRKAGNVAIPVTLDDPDLVDDADPKKKDAARGALLAQHREAALRDDFGHGSHVAGIITGGPARHTPITVLEREDRIDEAHLDSDTLARVKVTRERSVSGPEADRFHGIARKCRIVSLRVLDENGNGRSSDVIRALEYIRETLNDNPKLLRVHGVNLSVGYEFEAEMFACGQSPICSEVDRLVKAGVVVVTAAGNTGYGTVTASVHPTKVGLSNTINDPGNAELAITVGATHRDSPHTYGVSYFSSKGPTGDGRLKPDLVAPGERITSCAAGKKLEQARREMRATAAIGPDAVTAPGAVDASPAPGATASPAAAAGEATATPSAIAYYVEDSGTSMAAPHVSGAIAAFLSIRREFIGRPLDVKRIFLESAIPLGRERYFEGHGLLDLMRAIQSV